MRIRSASEIFSTLDDEGTLENLPFMPEMLQYCGQVVPVFKTSHKTCNDRGLGLRRMDNTVHLGNLRCDGSAHGGCQAACLLYWKEAWLERVEPGATPRPAELTEEERQFVSTVLEPATTKSGAESEESEESDEVAWRCQATDARAYSTQLHGWEWRQYIGDVRNWGLYRLVRFLAIEAFNRYQKLSAQRLPKWLVFRQGHKYPFIVGRLEKGHTPTVKLDLQPGDLVRIKSKDDIVATIDTTQMNRGLTFDSEMVKFCGRTAMVRDRVSRLIDEPTGKMIHIKTDCIILEGVTCTADYHRLCPRGIYPYWREIWLEKVG
jgi:hypothetical protein